MEYTSPHQAMGYTLCITSTSSIRNKNFQEDLMNSGLPANRMGRGGYRFGSPLLHLQAELWIPVHTEVQLPIRTSNFTNIIKVHNVLLINKKSSVWHRRQDTTLAAFTPDQVSALRPFQIALNVCAQRQCVTMRAWTPAAQAGTWRPGSLLPKLWHEGLDPCCPNRHLISFRFPCLNMANLPCFRHLGGKAVVGRFILSLSAFLIHNH